MKDYSKTFINAVKEGNSFLAGCIACMKKQHRQPRRVVNMTMQCYKISIGKDHIRFKHLLTSDNSNSTFLFQLNQQCGNKNCLKAAYPRTAQSESLQHIVTPMIMF